MSNKQIHRVRHFSLCLFLAICLAACSSPQPLPSLAIATPTTGTRTPLPSPTARSTPSGMLSSQPTNTLTFTPPRTSRPVPPSATAESTPTPLPAPASGQPITPAKITMIDRLTGWAGTIDDHLLRTTDGGKTWLDVTPPQGGIFAFLDSTHAWATLGVPESCLPVQQPTRLPQCVLTPPAKIWRTEDGGGTWQESWPALPDAPHYQAVSMQFINWTTGWYMAANYPVLTGTREVILLRTDDHGTIWSEVSRGFTDSCLSRAMVFLSSLEGWVSVDCRSADWPGNTLQEFLDGVNIPLLKQTMDGGNTWIPVSLPAPRALPPDLASIPSRETRIYCGASRISRLSPAAFTLGIDCSLDPSDPNASNFNFEYLTPDAGKSWLSWPASGSEMFVDPTVGWRLFSEPGTNIHRLQQTHDSGRNWSIIKTVTWESARFDFIDRLIGWAVVASGDMSAFLTTSDGGRTWTEIQPVTAPSPAGSEPPGAGLAWKDLGQIQPLWISSDQNMLDRMTEIDLFASPTDPKRLVSCSGDKYEISVDGGNSWSSLPSPGLPPGCRRISLDSHPDSVYAAFNHGQENNIAIYSSGYVTFDRGQSWKELSPPEGYAFGGFWPEGPIMRALFFKSRGDSGYQYTPPPFIAVYSSDGGRSWTTGHLPCPAAGPCVRWGPLPIRWASMAPQPVMHWIEISLDGGNTWDTQESLKVDPNQTFVAELAALSSTEVALLTERGLRLSRDRGRSWLDVSLPLMDDSDPSYRWVQMLPNGALLAYSVKGYQGLLLPGAETWCPTNSKLFWHRLEGDSQRLWSMEYNGPLQFMHLRDMHCQ